MDNSLLYFNDHEPFCTNWLGRLWPNSTISRCDVADIGAEELEEHHRVHLFAGIGGWEYALRLAEWPEELEAWTGSCPCQPFSAGGKRLAHADSRDSWPSFSRLVNKCHPPVIFGEQVASDLGRSGSLEYDMTWKRWDMPSGEPICRLAALGRRISVLDSGGWPIAGWLTPTARDYKDGDCNLENNPVSGRLGRMVLLSSTAPMGRRGELSPAFCLWLMGYPTGWNESVLQGTR